MGGCTVSLTTDEIRQRARSVLTSQNRPTVLSSLLITQDELGYLPNEAIKEIAAFNEASVNDVWGVASFYTNFRFSPPSPHMVEVCWGPTCHLLGAPKILEQVMDACGLVEEGDTEDGRMTLKYNTCLGACSQAPVISLNHRIRGRITPEAALQLIKPLLGQKP